MLEPESGSRMAAIARAYGLLERPAQVRVLKLMRYRAQRLAA